MIAFWMIGIASSNATVVLTTLAEISIFSITPERCPGLLVEIRRIVDGHLSTALTCRQGVDGDRSRSAVHVATLCAVEHAGLGVAMISVPSPIRRFRWATLPLYCFTTP